MAILRLFILVALVGVALSGPPYRRDLKAEECRSNCPCSPFGQKLYYAPGKTYIYDYKGSSEVFLDGAIPDAKTRVDWQAEVSLDFLSNCKVAIGISKPVVNGHAGDHIVEELLAAKPMMATIRDGVILGISADKDDHPTGLNMKRGIISSFQNVLPFISSSIVNKTFIEIDVLGMCPTTYTVTNLLQSWKVTKTKDHKYCSHEYDTGSQSIISSLILNAPGIPLEKSGSVCEQFINKMDNITHEVRCRDENIIKSLLPAQKQLRTIQESILTFKRINNGNILPKVNEENHPRQIVFEVSPQPLTKELEPKVELLLKQLNDNVEKNVTRESASYLAKIIGMLYRLPEDSFVKILKNIRTGKYSINNYKRLEDLFLDAMAMVGNAGAVHIMVDEATSGRISGGRSVMYTLGLQLMRNPSIHSIKAVEPLFSSKYSEHVSPSMTLAAGSLVRKYCAVHPHCLQDAPVQSILQQLTKTLRMSCSASSTRESKLKALTALKTIGNIANITNSVESAVLKCIKSGQVDVYVRAAATEAYRHASCHNQPTDELLKLSKAQSEETEVRIASYLAAIKCASYEEIEELISHIAIEKNIQVRSFILSHLHNLQRSDAPYLRGLRYNLTSFVIPSDYEQDFRKYSFNRDYSYYLSGIGLGAGVDTNLVFTPQSYLPKHLQTNVTIDLFNNVINIGEFSIRIENIESMIESFFAQQTPRGRSGKISLDAFLRLFGQEIAFISSGTDSSKFLSNQIVESFLKDVIHYLMQMRDAKNDYASAFQMNGEYFVSTSQGIPLQFKCVTTAILGFQMQSKIQSSDWHYKAAPILSVHVNAFVGYSFGVKTGLRAESQMLSQTNKSIEMQQKTGEGEYSILVDSPSNLTLLNLTAHHYMTNKLPGREDQRLSPGNSYPKTHFKRCSPIDVTKSTGVEVCTEITTPDFSKINPLGDYDVVITLKKIAPHKPLLKISGLRKIEDRLKAISAKLECLGSTTPLKGELGIEYKTESRDSSLNMHSLKIFGQRSNNRKILHFILKNVRLSMGRKHEMIASYAEGEKISPSDKVLYFLIEGRNSAEEREGKLELKTDNLLSKYIKANIEVDVATNHSRVSKYVPPKSVDIRKFEASVVLPNIFNTTSFIRKEQLGENTSLFQYRVHSTARTPKWEMFKVNGTVDCRGDVSKLDHVSKLNLTVNVSSHCFQCESAFVWTNNSKRALLSLKNHSSPDYTFVFNASLSKEMSSSNYLTKVELLIPSCIPVYTVEGLISGRSKMYEVDLTAKKDNRAMYQIKGPVIIEMTRSEFKQESNFTIKHISQSEEYSVGSELLLSHHKNRTKLDIKSNGAPSFALEGEVQRKDWSISSVISVAIPKMIDAELKADQSPSMLQVFLHGYFRPNTPESQRAKALTILNLEQKEIMISYDYDLDKNPQKAKIEATYALNVAKMFASVKGKAEISREKYIYSAEALLGSLGRPKVDKNGLKVDLKSVETQRDILVVDCQCNNQNGLERFSVKTEVKYSPKSSPQSGLDMSSEFDVALPNPPHQMTVKGKATFKNKKSGGITIFVDSSTDSKEESQTAHYRIKVLKDEQQNPITETNLEFSNKPEFLMTKVLLNLESSSNLNIDGQLEMIKSPKQVIGDGSLKLRVKIPSSKVYTLSASKEKSDAKMSLSSAGQQFLTIEQFSPKEGMWITKVTTPSRVAEAHSKYTSDSASLSIYPNRHESDEKYELEGYSRRSGSSSSSQLDTQARIKYPGREQGLGIRVGGTSGLSSSKGIIEIDIFRNPDEKVVVNVSTAKLSEHSYSVETSINIPSHKIAPRVDLNVTLSPTIKKVQVMIKKSSTSPPVLESTLSLVHSTEKDASLYGSIRTPSEHYELISALQMHELWQCRGRSINGTFVSRTGSYDFASAVCAPGYLEFGVKNSSDDQMFMVKVGMKNPASIKCALDLVFNSSKAITVDNVRKMESTMNLYGRHEYLPKIPMVLVGADLWSPKLVSLDAYYNVSGVAEYKERVLKPLMRGANQISEELFRKVPQGLKLSLPETLPELANELKEIKRKLCNEVNAFLEEIGLHLPSWEELKIKVQQFYQTCSQIYYKGIEKLNQYIKYYLHIDLTQIQHKLKDFDRKIQQFLRDLLSKIKDAPMKGVSVLEQIFEHLENSIFDWIKEKFEQFKQMIKAKLQYIEKAIIHCYQAFKEKIKSIICYISQNPIIKKIIEWIESIFNKPITDNDDEPSLIEYLVTRFYSFPTNVTSNLFRVQVPLHRPVASLIGAISSIGIPLPSWRSSEEPHCSTCTFISNEVSLYGRIGEDYIKTFEGVKVPMKKGVYSPCEILMAQVFNNKITMKKPNSQNAEVKIVLDTGKSFNIFLNKRPSIPILSNTREKVIDGAKVQMLSAEKFKVFLKGLTLHINGNLCVVELTPEARSEVQGLLAVQSNSEMFSKDPRQLFERFRINKRCHIPEA